MRKAIVLKCILPLILLSLDGFGQTATFSSNFEDQNTDPEIGRELIELYDGDTMYVAVNPHPDIYNSSNYVLKLCTDEGSRNRAEYTVWRTETNEKKYIYTWKRYHAPDMFTDIDITVWCSYNQWKTWPCESGGSDEYDFSDEICYGGGIFNDLMYEDDETAYYTSRAAPDCGVEFLSIPTGTWNEFVLEIYWTNTENGYYRIWRNDTLSGYSDNIKTLFDGFLEGTCDMYWSTGLYVSWAKTGNETQDTLTAYIDDITIYDIDSGFTVAGVCPDCEAAPPVPTDSSVYKINLHGSYAADGYNNYMTSYLYDTSAIDVSNTFGQSNGIDVYIWSDYSMGTGSLSDECFPGDVINPAINWNDAETRHMHIKDLNPANTYTVKVLAATGSSGANRGTQIWTTDENRDTVFAAGNTCDMAELTNLVPEANGDLTVNVSNINGGTAYMNSIEIVEHINTGISIPFAGSPLFRIPGGNVLRIYTPHGRLVTTAKTTEDAIRGVERIKRNIKGTENYPTGIYIYTVSDSRGKNRTVGKIPMVPDYR